MVVKQNMGTTLSPVYFYFVCFILLYLHHSNNLPLFYLTFFFTLIDTTTNSLELNNCFAAVTKKVADKRKLFCLPIFLPWLIINHFSHFFAASKNKQNDKKHFLANLIIKFDITTKDMYILVIKHQRKWYLQK